MPAPAPSLTPRATAGSTEPIKPGPVKTLLVKPGGHVLTASAAPLYLPTLPPTAEAEAPSRFEPAPAPVPALRQAVAVPTPITTRFGAYSAPLPPVRPSAAPQQPAQAVRTGWMIQVGAYPAETEAKQRLSSVKSKAGKLLAAADGFTESIKKGSDTYYRARFTGFDKDRAEAACKFLKKNDVDCVTIHN